MKIIKFVLFSFLLIFLFLNLNCSVYRAGSQPDKKNMSVLTPGTHRDIVLAEFGNPIFSGIAENGETYDIFSFIQGYGKGTKAARAFTHGTLDVLSLGLWEIIANPIEGMASGKPFKIKIFYSSKNFVTAVKEIKIPEK